MRRPFLVSIKDCPPRIVDLYTDQTSLVRDTSEELLVQLESLLVFSDTAGTSNNLNEFDFDSQTYIGGTRHVSKILHTTSGQWLCLKELSLLSQLGEAQRELLISSVAPSLGILRVQCAFYDPSRLSVGLVYDLASSSVADVLRTSGFVAEAQCCCYTKQLLCGLGHLHAHGILHRDIKPRNLLIQMDGSLVIADFGKCTTLKDDACGISSFEGTVLYMSPQRIASNSYSFEEDIWSLGISLYEMLTGRHPFLSVACPPEVAFWSLLSVYQDEAKLASLVAHDAQGLMSDLPLDFILQCLSPTDKRPSAKTLKTHAWLTETGVSC